MSIFDIISLFGGIALFLYGMRIMGDGLKHSSSTALKKAMEKVTNNPFIGFMLGLFVTALIQSSTATIVLTSGLVGAGIITLGQSIGIIIGANVGTTVTGQIIRLLDIGQDAAPWLQFFKPSTLAPLAAIAGIILIMAVKSKNSNLIGDIAIGFGILFTGLLNMTAAVTPLSSSEEFSQLFIHLSDSPFLGFLAGTGVAFILQSSSATIGILQALSVTGKLTFGSIYAVIIGIYIGDCVTTAICCSIGSSKDAQRTGVMHILFNLSEIVLVLIGVNVLRYCGVLSGIWDAPITSGGIANANTLFKLASAVLLLPVCGIYEKTSRILIKDTPLEKSEFDTVIDGLDKKLYTSPELALSAAFNVLKVLSEKAFENVNTALDALENFSQENIDLIENNENGIDMMTDRVSEYLVQMSNHIDPGSETNRLNYYIKCASEFERIGDLAVNIGENATNLYEKNVRFTPGAEKEIVILREACNEVMNYTKTAFSKYSLDAANHIEPVEEIIDDLVNMMKSNHFRRLQYGDCNQYSGAIFLDMLTNVERVSDQCANVGLNTISLYDNVIAEAQHDYIKRLHMGEDAFFNKQYDLCRDKYIKRMEEIKD